MRWKGLYKPAETVENAGCLKAQLDSVAALHQQEGKEPTAHGTQGPPTWASGNQE